MKFRLNCARESEWALLDSLVLAGKSAVARRGIAGSGSEAGGGRVFGQSSASGSRPRQQARPAVKPEAQKKAGSEDDVY